MCVFAFLVSMLTINWILGKQDRILLVTEKMNLNCRLDRAFHGPMSSEVAIQFAKNLFSGTDKPVWLWTLSSHEIYGHQLKRFYYDD